ncbi:MAG: PLP-dependent enzyme glutamate decarboxylase [Ilumatobacteraceae bacterium]|nr:PLP-dependent enzyme glutamate decarboxylase [Ilumatobacteraceae bacterium]
MALRTTGLSPDEAMSALEAMKGHDVRWREGRAFTLTYHGGDEVVALAERAYRLFSGENALNVEAFPSLRTIQAEVVDVALGWLGGPPGAAGFMTSGGTESILLSVLGARERGRTERGVTTPNIVLPTSAHAAFEKACHYFDVESRRIPVLADWRADPDAMAAAIDDDTVLVVASAPQYPQGVIDPVAAIAAIAADRGVGCHVDACMGGVILPYLARLGHPIPPWNFAVDGVTSMSVDLHKFGYTAKGASVIAYRTKALRSHQTYVTDNWLGGLYGSSGILGTKSGGSMGAAWAVINHLGDEGYLRLAESSRRAAEELVAGVRARPVLALRAEPDATLVTFGAADPVSLDIYAVADALWARGWFVDKQGPPASLHLTVNAIHDGKIDGFVADLDAALAAVSGAATAGVGGTYGTVE